MTEIEQKYYEICKTLKPIDTGNSLHIYSEDYEVEDKIVSLLWAIGNTGEPDFIEIKPKNQKSISEIIDEAIKKRREEREEIERKEILETFKWIKVERYMEKDITDDSVDWKKSYFELLEHHKKETDFLIKKIRELV